MESWFINPFAEEIWHKKYAGISNDIDLYLRWLADTIGQYEPSLGTAAYRLMRDKKFLPGGRILAWAGRPSSFVSLMNCTTHRIQNDSLEAISNAAYAIMRASSRGQGIGVSLSTLRPKDAPVNNAAQSSTGAISFMEMLSAVGRTIGQEGRRAALLFSLDVGHPDIWRKGALDVVCPKCSGAGCSFCSGNGKIPYDFLHIKSLPGRVENANISVMLSDEFMNAVVKDELFHPNFWGYSGMNPFNVSGSPKSAREMFHKIAEMAWESAEPGVLFWDTSKNTSNSEVLGFPIEGVNACSEQVLDHEGVCNLGSLNLNAYVRYPFTDAATFSYGEFSNDVKWCIRILDQIVDLELTHGHSISLVQENSLRQLRRVGLGVMGLADAMAALGFSYGDKQSREFTEKVFEELRDAAYTASISLAQTKGAAPAWNKVEDRKEVIKTGFFKTLPETIKEEIIKHGTRNITLLSVAPTGTISNLLGVTSGIEPLFAPSYTRRVQMNGVDEFVEYVHPGYARASKLGKEAIYKGAYQVTPDEHLAIQSIAQRYVDQSISKTVNLPGSATIQDVTEVYRKAWELGIKGVTIYRDNSRSQQILYQESTTSEACPNCGNGIEHKEGCKSCVSCGWSVCSL